MNSKVRHQVSCVLNVILTVAVVALAFRRSPRPAPPGAKPAASAPEVRAPAPTRQPLFSSGLSTADQRRRLVDRLREENVPEEVLLRIVLADIEEKWAPRFEACQGDHEKLARIQLEHDMGRDAEMSAALGAAAFKRWDQQYMLREAMLGSKLELTAGEAEAIYELKKKLQRRQWEIDGARLDGRMDDSEISTASAKAYSDFGQQMEAVMGTERFARAMRGDDGGAALKRELAKVNADNSQFEKLLKAEQQMNERRAALDSEYRNDMNSELYAQRLQTLAEEQNQEYRRVLGDDAFEALQKEQNGSYMKMRKYSATWGLNEGKIESVYGALKYYEKQIEDYRDQAHLLEAQGERVDWDAVSKNLQQFTEQTRQKLQAELGQERFDRMQQNGVFPFTETTPAPHTAPGH